MGAEPSMRLRFMKRGTKLTPSLSFILRLSLGVLSNVGLIESLTLQSDRDPRVPPDHLRLSRDHR